MNPVAEISSIQAALEAKRTLPRCLVEGTAAMRAKGATFLPQFPAETDKAYANRLAVSVLLPSYRDAIDLACGLIFRKEVEEADAVPTDAAEWLDDIDLSGRNITQFTEDVLRDAFCGVSYIFASYPTVPVGSTLAKERAMGARPYLVHIKAEQVLGWRSEMVNGRAVISQFRYKECVQEPSGPFGSVEVERVRVLEPGMVSVFVFDKEKDDWVLDPAQSGPVTLKEVPIIPIYTGRTGVMEGKPPLLDLAYKNAQHWQLDSDLQNVIHKTCVPLFVVAGAETEGDIVISPNGALKLAMGGTAEWAELSGSSIPTAQANIANVKTEMQAMAGKILDKGIVKTATQAGIESTQAMSQIQAWALGTNAAINQAWTMAGKWINQDLGTLQVNCDVDTAKPDAPFLTEIRNAVVAGLLTKETYLKILFEAEVLPEGFEIQEELDKLEMQAPSLEPIPPRVPKPGTPPAPGE